ncbi:MAG: hypothetical protein RBQ65_09105 [Sphaerochaeta sp.]|nr:hypothetical protein [Sphaerochaeta sp.]
MITSQDRGRRAPAASRRGCRRPPQPPRSALKEVGEVFEVVAGDEDTRACACRGADRRDPGRPVGCGVRGIEEGKGLHTEFART